MPWVCLRFVIVVLPDHTHLLFLSIIHNMDMVIHSDNRRRNMNWKYCSSDCDLSILAKVRVFNISHIWIRLYISDNRPKNSVWEILKL